MRILEENALEDLSIGNSMDPIRDKIIAWVRENWETVKHYIKCPLEEDPERGCYLCSDGLVAACYTINKGKFEVREDEDEFA